MVPNALTILGFLAMFSMMVKKLSQPPNISPVGLKNSIDQNGTFFKDYYGGEEIKEKFREIIDFLKNPEKYK